MPTTRSERGFTYVGLLIAVAVLGASLAVTGELWRTAARREREAQLLFVGDEFRDAIAGYYRVTPAGTSRYPRRLEDLLEDRRAALVRHHLRRLYADPMSRKPDWRLVAAPGGGIAGVYSSSDERPLKSAGFAALDTTFEGAERYSDWKFVFVPRN
jgi:type II secretory pathway pseudopilin PulG